MRTRCNGWGTWKSLLGLAGFFLLGTVSAWAQRPCWICPLPEAPAPPRASETKPPPSEKPAETTPGIEAPQTPGMDFSGQDATASAGESLSLADAAVGYIDPAIVANQFRLRYDTAYRNRRPNRAEFFYARGGPAGPGLPLPESNVDYQDVFPYIEVALNPFFSVFVEGGTRFLNPTINANTAGFADMMAGFKYALVACEDQYVTFQLKNYAPTGDADRGLGTNHYSIEPGLLVWQKLDDNWCFNGEFRYWIPVGGTDFAGSILRYGVGLSYGRPSADHFWITPVVEFVGWTCLDGKQTVVRQLPAFTIEDAAGDTIVNAKVGLRMGAGLGGDFYVGWGRALTGDTWYKDVLRLEYRLFF